MLIASHFLLWACASLSLSLAVYHLRACRALMSILCAGSLSLLARAWLLVRGQ